MRQQVWRDYSLFGMGMQRVDAERLECGEP
jgi:hypothetical protein